MHIQYGTFTVESHHGLLLDIHPRNSIHHNLRINNRLVLSQMIFEISIFQYRFTILFRKMERVRISSLSLRLIRYTFWQVSSIKPDIAPDMKIPDKVLCGSIIYR